MKSNIAAAFLIFLTLIFCSCSASQFGTSYRKTNPYKLNGANTSPTVQTTSSSNHGGRISSLGRKGYVPLGVSNFNARFNISSEEGRILALEKKADIAVVSTKYLGRRTERVAVPVSTTVVSGQSGYGSRYGNNSGYRSAYNSGSASQAEATQYVYQNQPYQLWNHRCTLLVRKSRLTQ